MGSLFDRAPQRAAQGGANSPQESISLAASSTVIAESSGPTGDGKQVLGTPSSIIVPSSSNPVPEVFLPPSPTTSFGLPITTHNTISSARSRVTGLPSSTAGGPIIIPSVTPPAAGSFSTDIVHAISPTSLSPTIISTSSAATETTTSLPVTAAASSSSGPNLKVIIPAVVVPVCFIAFGLFWWFMRKRYNRHLKNEPDFMYGAAAAKESSRSNSSLSHPSPQARGGVYKVLPTSTTQEVSRSITTPPERPPFSTDALDDVRTAVPVNQHAHRGLGPEYEGLVGHDRSDSRTYDRFGSPRRAPSNGTANIIQTYPNSQLPRGQSPTSGRALDLNPSLRKPLPTPLDTTSRGAYNSGSPISQFSPIINDSPTVDGMALARSLSSNATLSHPRQAMPTIMQSGHSPHIGDGSPTLSPQLPPPATRSQLIPREAISIDTTTTGRFFASTPMHQHTNSNSQQQEHLLSPQDAHNDTDRHSMISAPDEVYIDNVEDDAKSDISSLNEVDRFEFETRNASRSQTALHTFVEGDRTAGGSGRNTPTTGNPVYRW